MPQPTPYSLSYDFTAFQVSNPTTPLPADKVEIEFNNIATTTDEIITNLALIQRDDGGLANESVGTDQLAPGILTILGAGTGEISAVAAIDTEILALYAIRTDITTVAGIAADVTSVANIAAAVSAVAAIDSDVTAVANNITNVNAVGGNIANINTVAGISANVTSVAGNATNINIVAGLRVEITRLALISGAIAGVYAIDDEVVTVAGMASDIASIGAIAAEVAVVAGISVQVQAVAANETNISAVAAIDTDVSAVAAIDTDVSAVAANETNISAVATNETNINTVATNITDVNTVAANMTTITDAASNIPKANRTATTNPTVNDDSGDGYSEASIWVNTTSNEIFFCADSALGAAVWVSVIAAGALSSLADVTLTGVATGDMLRYNGSMWVNRTAAQTRTDLGLVIGTNVQAYDAELAAIAGLTSAANKGITFTGAGTASTYDLTAFALTLLDDTDAATMRTTLGLGTSDNVSFNRQTLTANGAASTSVLTMTGTPYTGGSGTTTFPLFLMQDGSATPSTSWSTSGTVCGINSSASSGNFVDYKYNGTTKFSVDRAYGDVTGGSFNGSGNITGGATGTWSWYGRTKITSPVDGTLLLKNDAGTGFTSVQLGGTSSSFPMIKRNSAAINFRLADDSADANITAGVLTLGTALAVTSGGTGGVTQAAARTGLGLVIGTDVQAYDAELAALAGLTSAANAVPVFTGSGTAGLITLTASTLVGMGSSGNAAKITLGGGLSMSGAVLSSGWTQLSPQNSTSGTSIDFSGIPSTAKVVRVLFSGVSTSGTNGPILQLRVSGSPETSGYAGSEFVQIGSGVGGVNATTGVQYNASGGLTSARIMHGQIELSNLTGNTWVITGSIGMSDAAVMNTFAFSKSLSGALDGVRLTTLAGSDTFDAGTMNVMYM